jgi:hypothetical protein
VEVHSRKALDLVDKYNQLGKMQPFGSEPVAQLLLGWREGNEDCLNRLIPLVESDLRHIARRYMHWERPGHTLQTTALVKEAYVRLVDQAHVNWKNRAHFMAVAARLMRHILVDHARSLCREKRGGGVPASLSTKALFSRLTNSPLAWCSTTPSSNSPTWKRRRRCSACTLIPSCATGTWRRSSQKRELSGGASSDER